MPGVRKTGLERLLILSNARITKDDVMMFALPN